MSTVESQLMGQDVGTVTAETLAAELRSRAVPVQIALGACRILLDELDPAEAVATIMQFATGGAVQPIAGMPTPGTPVPGFLG